MALAVTALRSTRGGESQRAEYYLRLERGRAKNPSPQIIDALARALQLDIKATRYFHRLASSTISQWDHSVLVVCPAIN